VAPIGLGLLTRWRDRLVDLGLVLAITAGVGLLSQRWTGLDTPDSSFYLSLGLHGDAITDRVAEPYYAWTRLGVLLPMRALTGVLGTFPGLEAYRLLLILICVTAAYLLLRRFGGPLLAAALTTMIILNTVLLGYLGNPYVTRSVLAAAFALLAVVGCTYLTAGTIRAPAPSAAALAGAVAGLIVGWLVMTNPYGALVFGALWVILVCAAHLRLRERPWSLPLTLAASVAGSVTSWGLLLLAGRAAFPRLDWISTYRVSLATIDQSNFASDVPVWLGDISLLVPVSILAVTVIHVVICPRSLPAQAAALLSVSTIALTFALLPVMGGVTLESPMYQAFLWPTSLLAAALSAIAATQPSPAAGTRLRPPGWLSAIAALIAVIVVALAGRWPGAMTLSAGILLAAAMVAGCCLLWLLPQLTTGESRRPGRAGMTAVAGITGLALLLAGAQLLQNSRRDLGLYYLSPYANAFLGNAIEAKVRTAVNAQDFVLANTTTEDQIQLWVGGDWAGGDRELYVVAGMQMWGPNIATLEPTLSTEKVTQLRRAQPTVLEMIAPSMEQILQFWASLPTDANPTPPDCYDFNWPTERVRTGHLCLTRLTWSAR
jgi:hypothetical protein